MSVEDAIATLVAELPKPVQEFITGSERARVVLELSKKYGLHADQAGEFERAFIFMLLGISSPPEFVVSLREAGISPEKVNGLVEDVNKDVFMRLREEERRGSDTGSKDLVPATIAAPVAKEIPIYVAPAPAAPHPSPMIPVYSPLPAVSAPPSYIEKAIEKPVAPKQVPPPQILPGQMPERPVPPPPNPAPTPAVSIPMPEAQPLDTNARVIHTMARDMKALKDGVDPIRVAHPAPPAWVAAEAPRPQVAASVPPTTQPAPERESPEAAMRTHLKQYGVDPYREPMQ
ncbi:MAG: hypothetical protein V4681_00470 [Patescibacteria group bacterium]